MQIPVYLINLSTSPERLEKSNKRLAEQGINYTRVEGVLGKALTQQEVDQHYSEQINHSHYHTPLTLGQIGCYYSHRKVWQLIAEGDAPFGIIMEDDFHLTGDLKNAIDAIQSLTAEWDLIKLAAYQSRERKIAYSLPINDDFNLVVHSKAMSGGAATALTKAAAKRLLAATDKFGRPCDTDIQHMWETGVDVLSLMPYPVAQDMDFESTISAKKESRKKYFWKRKIQQLKASIANKKAVKAQIARLKALR